jgi:hypothetical protein
MKLDYPNFPPVNMTEDQMLAMSEALKGAAAKGETINLTLMIDNDTLVEFAVEERTN